MMLLKRLNMLNWLKKGNNIKNTDTNDLVKKADYDTKTSETDHDLGE